MGKENCYLSRLFLHSCVAINLFPSLLKTLILTSFCLVLSWPGTLCCVLGQDTLLSQCLSLPRCINGYLLFVGET